MRAPEHDAAAPGDEENEAAALEMQGAQLEPEEMAALAAVLAQLRAQDAARAAQPPSRAVPDRTLHRRRDLGLWSRPGAGQWRRSAGPS